MKILNFSKEKKSNLYYSTLLTIATQLVLVIAYLVVFFLLLYLMEKNVTYIGITYYSALLCFLVALYSGFNYIATSSALASGYDIVADLRTRLADHLRKLPLSFFRNNNISKISGCFLHDMMDAEAIFCVYLREIIACAAIVILLSITLCGVGGVLGIVMLLTAALSLPFIYKAYNSTGAYSPEYMKARNMADNTLLEYLGGINELKSCNMTGTSFLPWVKANKTFLKLALKMEINIGILGRTFFAILDFSYFIVIVVGFLLVTNEMTEIHVLIFFVLISGCFYVPLQDLGASIAQFRFSTEALKRIYSLLAEKSLPQLSGYTEPKGNSIIFDKVSFSYGEHKVLDGVSFTLPEGTVTALVGESGSGKTSLANLLLRFWDVDSGCIILGGTDIRTFSQDDFYQHFSVVFQDVYLFNDTIINNIRLSKPEASDADVIAAAKKARCHDFIIEFPDGYQTVVGERGSRLSGGERQRIAIARAILKNAPILILDEVTASIDPENELLIQNGLTNLVQGKTLLVIAHRLSTIREAHQILVLKNGLIVEKGTHLELMEKNGTYHTFWSCQERMKSWSLKK